MLWRFFIIANTLVPSKEARDDAKYEETLVKATTTEAVGTATNITLTQNSAYT